jgi:predicted amidohydrolase
MRVLIRNGVVIDGTGAPPVADASLVIEDHAIELVLPDPAPAYDRADVVIEADGGFVIPGVLNHHAHGMTRSPLMIIAEPALSDARAERNRRRLLREGVTRVLDVDGFALVEEGRAASRFPGLTVLTTTLHTPRHFEWVTEGEFVFAGLRARHWTTVADQLALGAVAIGEIGPGIDDHWIDHTILPFAFAKRGGRVDTGVGRQLRLASQGGQHDEVERLIAVTGATITADELSEVLEEGHAWCRRARIACEEALDVANGFDVPVILHHTPPTYELVLSAAKRLGPRLICAHSNFGVSDPGVAVSHARELRSHGALIDVMTGDATGAKAFLPNDEVTHALMAAGCVDLISTDYVGGYWEPMLSVIERAVASGVIAIEAGVRAVTSAVADALPRFAPQRGTLEAGKVADVVVTEPGHLSRVSHVVVSGIPARLSMDGSIG